MYQIFLIHVAFQSSDRVELDFWGSVIKIALNFKSQGTKKSNFPPKGPTTFQILGNESLIIADYKYAKIFKFAMLDIKFQLKDDNILYQFWIFDWMNLNEYKGSFLFKSPSSSHSFILNTARLEMFTYS